MNGSMQEQETMPRPEELIADIYRQLTAIRKAGGSARGILMNISQYRLIQWYRSLLGEAPGGGTDYLDRYEIFGLEVFIDDVPAPLVRTVS